MFCAMREFAEGEIGKRVEEMDERVHLDEAVTRQCLNLADKSKHPKNLAARVVRFSRPSRG
jgi:hypothetical protein